MQVEGFVRDPGNNPNGDNPNIGLLKQQFADGKLGRREFVRFATLLGIAAPAAYALIGETPLPVARAAEMPSGGTLRVLTGCAT